MFADYQRLVIQDFEMKRATNSLSLRLLHPTAANLKKECIAICLSRFEKRDVNTLSAFFGECADAKAYAKAIDRFDTSKFKPLQNFLNKKTHNPDSKNIELLAWLINFEPRPWELGKTYTEKGIEEPLAEIPEKPSPEQIEFSLPGMSGPAIGSKRRNIIAALIIFILISVSMYSFWNFNSPRKIPNGQNACMFWNVDHYQEIACNKKPANDQFVIALDSTMLRQFKRIMKPDTITYNDKGKVWYIKRNNQLEYYTSGGRHPLYPHLTLRPITDHIIRTYIMNNTTGAK